MRVEQCPDCDGTGTIPGHDWQPREGLLAEMTVADWQRHVDAQGEHDCSYRRTLAVTPTIPDEPSVEQVEALMRKRGVTGLGQASTFTWSRRIFQQVLDVLREGPTDG